MTTIINILSIYSLAFLIKESDGPFGLIATIRNKLMRNKYCGVFFYKLLACWHCTGMHAGWLIYLLQTEHYSLEEFILWSLAGGAICLIVDASLSKLYK